MKCADCLGTGCAGVDEHPVSGAPHVWDEEDCEKCHGKGWVKDETPDE